MSDLDALDSGSTIIAGIDEVGRGALFGPVVAAVAIAPLSSLPLLIDLGVKDSKKLTATKRQKLIEPIMAAISETKIGLASAIEIERLNILQASLLAMKRAVLQLKCTPTLCLVDGIHKIAELSIPQQTLVKGDERSPLIAAASILAKVWRDNLIVNLATTYPQYDLAANKGYPTLKHRQALQIYGACPEHRRSFVRKYTGDI